MPLSAPLPDLDEILASMGEGGRRIALLDAGEGAAGNISVCIGWQVEVRRRFPRGEPIALPVPAPHLAGHTVLVTGSGRRLRDIGANPVANIGAVAIDGDGVTATLWTAPGCLFERLTSEWNSHLAVHEDTVARTGTNFHAVVHAQPPHITYLSHVPAYQDEAYFNGRVMRWEPETIVQLPQGVGILRFMIPGSEALMAANVESLRSHRIDVWGKHGVMARSDISVTRAVDRIEYAEAGARYEYMDLVAGGRGGRLSDEELRSIVTAFGVETDLV
ncbi:MAG: class II aldolase/adducin family protein [Candidatus Limnocylindrales bacterium]